MGMRFAQAVADAQLSHVPLLDLIRLIRDLENRHAGEIRTLSTHVRPNTD